MQDAGCANVAPEFPSFLEALIPLFDGHAKILGFASTATHQNLPVSIFLRAIGLASFLSRWDAYAMKELWHHAFCLSLPAMPRDWRCSSLWVKRSVKRFRLVSSFQQETRWANLLRPVSFCRLVERLHSRQLTPRRWSWCFQFRSWSILGSLRLH